MGREALGGLIVPVVTPFDASGRVDIDALHKLAEGILNSGAAGLVALATTGAAHALDDEERHLVIDACAEACRIREVPLLVGAGAGWLGRLRPTPRLRTSAPRGGAVHQTEPLGPQGGPAC